MNACICFYGQGVTGVLQTLRMENETFGVGCAQPVTSHTKLKQEFECWESLNTPQ